jgi:NAD+ diphosphatase
MKIFDYCPRCKSSEIVFDGFKKSICGACSFTYYHNAAAAVVAILEYDGKIILIKRNREPSRGKLDLPGGFVDPRETAEGALRREIKEELKIEVGELKYIGSYPNIYKYKGVYYHTCDLFFHSKIDMLPADYDKTEIAELLLIDPSKVPLSEVAFESTRTCLEHFARDL